LGFYVDCGAYCTTVTRTRSGISIYTGIFQLYYTRCIGNFWFRYVLEKSNRQCGIAYCIAHHTPFHAVQKSNSRSTFFKPHGICFPGVVWSNDCSKFIYAKSRNISRNENRAAIIQSYQVVYYWSYHHLRHIGGFVFGVLVNLFEVYCLSFIGASNYKP